MKSIASYAYKHVLFVHTAWGYFGGLVEIDSEGIQECWDDLERFLDDTWSRFRKILGIHNIFMNLHTCYVLYHFVGCFDMSFFKAFNPFVGLALWRTLRSCPAVGRRVRRRRWSGQRYTQQCGRWPCTNATDCHAWCHCWHAGRGWLIVTFHALRLIA